MLIGRVVFGLGGECMCVASSAVVSQWFRGKELSFAFGLKLSVARLGSVAQGFVVPVIAQNKDLGAAFMFGFYVCVFALIMAVFLVIMDRYADKKDGDSAKINEDDKFRFADLKKFGMSFWLITASCVFVYMSIFPYE